jgi:hypothetical protein
LGGGAPERNDGVGVGEPFEFLGEETGTVVDLLRGGVSVVWGAALDDVGNVDVTALVTTPAQDIVELVARAADKGGTLVVFFPARGLSDEEGARLGGAGAPDDLVPVLNQPGTTGATFREDHSVAFLVMISTILSSEISNTLDRLFISTFSWAQVSSPPTLRARTSKTISYLSPLSDGIDTW